MSKILTEKYGWKKTSNYTFIGRLLEKGAISRRYPKYTLKPIITREEVAASKIDEVAEDMFEGSFVKLFSAFLSDKNVSEEEIEEMKKIISDFEKKNE